jgi:branched-chain amino acid transport system substrate-binding protein
MLKKVGAAALLAALVSIVVATTAWGSAKAPSRVSAATASVKCGKHATIGVAYPATGPDADLGATQWDWANWAKKGWNKKHSMKLSLVVGDTQLGAATNLAVPVAHAFASKSKMLAVVGPAGSQENQDSNGIYAKAKLVTVSGSATRVKLTRAPAGQRETVRGSFFRTVPNDGQQGDRVAFWIHSKLKKTHIYIIDDEEAYSQGLADQVASDLAKFGINAGRNHISQQDTNFSSVIDSIPSNTQVVYIPWQIPSQAQTFYQQLRAAGKTSVIVFGSDGTDLPGTFQPNGHGYVSGFPVDFSNPAVKSFSKAHHGSQELFGLPSYTAVLVDATAIKKACTAGHGKTTRAAVRKAVQKVKLTAKQSILGFPVVFLNKNKGNFQGPGDMGGAADFAIYQITSAGAYKRVG